MRATAATDFLQIESIVLNLDASLRVHARAHFFSWTQGLLQSLIRHELLICTLCHGKPPAFRADGFSMTRARAGHVQRPVPARHRGCARSAQGVGGAPLPAGADRRRHRSPLAGGAFARELERLGADAAPGARPARRRRPRDQPVHLRLPPRHVGRAPGLSRAAACPVAARRVGAHPVPAPRRAPAPPTSASGRSMLTVREHDILKWIYLGKSNFEIGAILKISPLTVKNHVQKILRKLNVVNRTQAIGKSLELRILNP